MPRSLKGVESGIRIAASDSIRLTKYRGGNFVRRCAVAYICIVDPGVATHCHLPLGIFTHVSVQRSWTSIGFPDASVPLPLKPPVAMAVSPKTVTFTSSYSALTYLVAFAFANASALFVTFPSGPRTHEFVGQ